MAVLENVSLKEYINSILESQSLHKVAQEAGAKEEPFPISPGSSKTYLSPVSQTGLPIYGPLTEESSDPAKIGEYDNVDIHAPEAIAVEELSASLENEPAIVQLSEKYAGISDQIESMFNEEVKRYNSLVEDKHKLNFPRNFKIRPLILGVIRNLKTRDVDADDVVASFFEKFFTKNTIKKRKITANSAQEIKESGKVIKIEEDSEGKFIVTDVRSNFIILKEVDTTEEHTVSITQGLELRSGKKTVSQWVLSGKRVNITCEKADTIPRLIPKELLSEASKNLPPDKLKTLRILEVLRSLGDGSFPSGMIKVCVRNTAIDYFRKNGAIKNLEVVSLDDSLEDAFSVLESLEDPENEKAFINRLNQVFKSDAVERSFKSLAEFVDEIYEAEPADTDPRLSNMVELQTVTVDLPDTVEDGVFKVKSRSLGQEAVIKSNGRTLTLSLPAIDLEGKTLNAIEDLEIYRKNKKNEDVLVPEATIKHKKVFKVETVKNSDIVDTLLNEGADSEVEKALKEAYPSFTKAMKTFNRKLENWRFYKSEPVEDPKNIAARILARAVLKAYLYGYDSLYRDKRYKTDVTLTDLKTAVENMAEELFDGTTLLSNNDEKKVKENFLTAARIKILSDPKTLFSKLGASFNIHFVFRYIATYLEQLLLSGKPSSIISKKDLQLLAKDLNTDMPLADENELSTLSQGYFVLKDRKESVAKETRKLAQSHFGSFFNQVILLLISSFSSNKESFESLRNYFLTGWDTESGYLSIKRVQHKGAPRITSTMLNQELNYAKITRPKINPSDTYNARARALLDRYEKYPDDPRILESLKSIIGKAKFKDIQGEEDRTLCVTIPSEGIEKVLKLYYGNRKVKDGKVPVELKITRNEKEVEKLPLILSASRNNYFFELDYPVDDIKSLEVLYVSRERVTQLQHTTSKALSPRALRKSLVLKDRPSFTGYERPEVKESDEKNYGEIGRVYKEVVSRLWKENYMKTSFYNKIKKELLKLEDITAPNEEVKEKIAQLREDLRDPYAAINKRMQDPSISTKEYRSLIRKRERLKKEIQFKIPSYDDFEDRIYEILESGEEDLGKVSKRGLKEAIYTKLGLDGSDAVPLSLDSSENERMTNEINKTIEELIGTMTGLLVESLITSSNTEEIVKAIQHNLQPAMERVSGKSEDTSISKEEPSLYEEDEMRKDIEEGKSEDVAVPEESELDETEEQESLTLEDLLNREEEEDEEDDW